MINKISLINFYFIKDWFYKVWNKNMNGQGKYNSKLAWNI